MGLFNKQKIKNEKIKISIEDLVPAIVQTCINHISKIDIALRNYNIDFNENKLFASTMCYYFSIWRVYIDDLYPKKVGDTVEKMYVEKVKAILADAFNGDKDVLKLIDNMDILMKEANNEANNSLSNGAFTDVNFTNNYLLSFTDEKNKNNIAMFITMTVLSDWVRPVSTMLEKTEIEY